MLKRFKIVSDRIVESTEENSPVLVFINPDENEKRELINFYKVDEHTLQSAMDPDELSRLEFEPDHLAFIYKRPKNYSGKEQLLFRTNTAGVFLFGNNLIVVMSEEMDPFDGKIFTKVTSLHDVMLKLIYRTIYHFLEHLKVMNMITDELEQKINKSMENKYLIHLFTLEKSLVYYLNAINSNGLIIHKLKQCSGKIGFTQEQMELLDDISVENSQCYRQAEIHSNILASLMDARASIVSNNLNVLMKTLNIITISIMVPTLVVSAFSMNVKIPLAHLDYAFWIVMTLATISVIVFFFIWKSHKW